MTICNAFDNLPFFPGAPTLTGMDFCNINSSNLSIGDHDLLVVPQGKRAMIFSAVGHNGSNCISDVHLQTKIQGKYYRLSSTTCVDCCIATPLIARSYIFDPGEAISAHIATNPGVNLFFTIILFDVKNSISSKKLTLFRQGNNLLYTVPESKRAFLINACFPGQSNDPTLFYSNDSGSDRSIAWNSVPADQAVSNENRIAIETCNNTQCMDVTCAHCLSAGDCIFINTDAATEKQFAWINVVEK